MTTNLSAASIKATVAGSTMTTRTLGARFGEVKNVLDFGADPTGGTDSRNAIQAAVDWTTSGNKGEIYFPPGTYLLNSAVTLNDGLSPSHFSIVLRGCGEASRIGGNFNDFLFKRVGLPEGGTNEITAGIRVIENLRMENSHATGGCLQFNGSITWSVRDCMLSANRCIHAGFNQGTTIQGCNFTTGGHQVGSYAIVLGENGLVSACDASGFETAVHVAGVGGCLIGNRMEVNITAIKLGSDPDFPGSSCSGVAIQGGSFESNGTCIDCYGGTGYFIIGGFSFQSFLGNLDYVGMGGTAFGPTTVQAYTPSSPAVLNATFNATCTSAGVMTINSVSSGTMALANILEGTGVNKGTSVATLLTGTQGAALSTYQLAGSNKYGIRLRNNAHHGLIYGCNVGSNFAIASISVENTSGSCRYLTFVSVGAGNNVNVQGAKGWDLPVTAGDASFVNCDNVPMTYTVANLPSGTSSGTPNAHEGDRFRIIDGAAGKVWGDAIAAGGSTHYTVEYDGSTWRVVGK